MNNNIVIFYHPYFSDGGVERTNITLAKGLKSKGYNVMLLTTVATQHYRAEVGLIGIELVEFGAGSASSQILKQFRLLWKLAACYENVYFISCQYYVNVVSMLVSICLKPFKRNIRFINSERNHLSEYTYRKGVKSHIIPLLVKLLYRYADVVISNSQETAKDLSEFIGREVIAVYNPTINERVDNLKSEVISETWFLKDTRPCVLSIGRLSFQKDYFTLLRAFSQVKRRIDARLVIIGDGDQRAELESYIKKLGIEKDVYLPGFVENPYKFMRESQVFVLSSVYEGLPNVLIEAIYLCLPCISTKCKSGPDEILLSGKGGLLVDVSDSRSMSEAIVEVLSDPVSATKRTRHAADNIMRFSELSTVNKFEIAINS